MPNTIKVIIVNGDNNARKLISDTISAINDIAVIGETESSDKGMKMVEELAPDVIIIGDFIRGTDGFRFSDAVVSRYPFHSIVLVTSAVGEEVYRLAMRWGIKEILEYPFSQIALSDVIYRAYDIKQKHHATMVQTEVKKESPVHERSAKIISVFSTKGGVGKTTISSNLAVLLKQSSKKVALLDLDVFSGDVALALDIVPKRSISDLVSDINKMDLDLLESYMFRHYTGVMVLPAPMKMEYGEFVAAEHVSKILKLLVKEYDYIVVDCASYMHDPVLIALDASDIILLVTTMDIFALKNLKGCISALEGLSYSRTKFKVVVNRAFKEAGISQKDIAMTLGIPVTAALPQEDQVIVSSVNQGTPAVIAYKKSKFSRGMIELGRKINGNKVAKHGLEHNQSKVKEPKAAVR